MDEKPHTSAAAPSALVLHDEAAATRALLDRELEEGEELLWAGQPIPSRLAKKNVAVVVFGVPWTAFAIFWTVGATAAGGFFGLFGVPFVLIGLGMLSSPYFAARNARRTLYALTNKRCIVLAPEATSRGMRVTSYDREHLGEMSRVEQKDGSGDLVFGDVVMGKRKGERTEAAGFLAIEDVHEVEKRVRKALSARAGTT